MKKNITHRVLQTTPKHKQEQVMNNRRWNYCYRQAFTGTDTGTVFDPTS